MQDLSAQDELKPGRCSEVGGIMQNAPQQEASAHRRCTAAAAPDAAALGAGRGTASTAMGRLPLLRQQRRSGREVSRVEQPGSGPCAVSCWAAALVCTAAAGLPHADAGQRTAGGCQALRLEHRPALLQGPDELPVLAVPLVLP